MRHWFAAALAVSLAAAPVRAEAPPPFADFTFKRVKVPGQGETRRITVQIEPEVTTAAATVAVPVPDPGAATAKDAFEWFWTDVSPSIAGAPERFVVALATLDAAPEGALSAPRLQALQEITEAHGATILAATVGTDVSPALVLAVIAVESGGNQKAESHKGAYGLMQLMPATAERFGVSDSADPAANIKGGVAYLNWLLSEFGDDPLLALAGYNAGENAVKRYEGVPPFPETRAYVPRVLAAWKVARGLCLTPPELPGDGCVFAKRGTPTNG